MNKIFVPAKAKINISLDVHCKRADGYHEVEIVMQSIDLADLLVFEKITEEVIELECTHPQVPLDQTNLIIKAVEKLKEKTKVNKGIKINLEKNIPIGAGLAGGSTDAAAALMAVNRLWDLKISSEEVLETGSELGADVPFCIEGGTCLAKGKGDVLSKLPPLPNLWVMLVVFPFSVSTAEIYGSFNPGSIEKRPDTSAVIKNVSDGETEKLGKNMGNVLESVTLQKYPVIAQRKRELENKGFLGVQMTGSGPTLFCLSNNKGELEQAARGLFLGEGEKILIARTVS